jgi:hypothetical protein
MATIVNFNGKKIIEPGVYAQVKSGIPVKPSTFSTGNVCIIDTGSGMGFGGGSGIDGEFAQGLNSVYSFQDMSDFQDFVRGGLLFDIADFLFNPQVSASGPETVHLVRAAETEPAEINFEFEGGGLNGGKVKFLTLNEGECANGRVAESLAKASISVIGPILVGDQANIQILGGPSITGLLTATSTSTSDFAQMIMEAINSGNSGYSAILQGGDVIVTAPTGTGASGNLVVLTTMNLPVQATASAPTISGGVDEVQATGTMTFTAPGSAGDVIGIASVGPPYTFFGYYTVQPGATNTDNAAGYATLINGDTTTHGYTASSAGAFLTITAPEGTGASFNGNGILVTAATGTVAATPAGSFAGGVDETLAEVDVTITNIGQAGSTISVSVGGVLLGTLASTGAGTTDNMASDLASLINANTSSGLNHGFTASATLSVVTITAPVGTGSTLNGEDVIVSTPFGVVPFLTIGAFTGGSDSGMLTIGYGAQMMVGLQNPAKFLIEFYEGTYRGRTPGGNDIGGLAPEYCPPNLIATSPEFSNIAELISWAKNDFLFSKRFRLDENYVITGNGTVDNADLATYADINLAVLGTTDYTPAALDRVLEDIRELDNTFFLCDRWGDEAQGVQNNKIWNHIQRDAEMNKFMIVGGGIDETKFEDGVPNSSISTAKFYNDTRVHVVHSGHKRANVVGGGFEKLSAFYHAANITGRLGGLEPQTPLTFKAIKITDFNHQLGLRERERALQAGVIHNRLVPGIGNVVNQGINTLQRNTQLINPDGTSFEISIMRIAAQLNKELILNMRPLFVGNNVGSASPADVKSFVEGYLFSRTATSAQDNLILSFKNVTVRLIEDYYDIKYGFVPNGPINKLFVTGFMLDSNLSA